MGARGAQGDQGGQGGQGGPGGQGEGRNRGHGSSQDRRQARVHVHLVLHSDTRMRLTGADLAYRGARPFWQRSLHGEALSRLRNRWAAYFYIVVEKKGWVQGASSHRAFRDFTVQTQWVMSLYTAEKITAVHAKRLLTQIPGRAQHLVGEIDFCEQSRVRAAVDRVREAAEVVLRSSLRPFKSIPAVDQWQEQFAEHRHRFKFLVLEGPSCTGKTQFARHLVPDGRKVFEINCAAEQEPALQGFNLVEFGLVLFDEVRPSVIAKQRKLFQAGVSEIQLGCSATNVHMYKVCTYRTRLVCCSNDWSVHLAALDSQSREWICQNSVHVWCMAPLWEQPPDS